MKKICILQNGLKYGGTDTFVLNLVSKLDSAKWDVTVVLSGADEDFVRIDELKSFGVKVEYTNCLNGTKTKLSHLKKLYHILKNGKFDVFQTNIDLFNGPNMLVSFLAGVPIRVCHSHNSEQGRELREGKTLSVALYQSLMRWLCWTFSNRYTGCSKKALDFLFGNKWKKSSKSWVVYNGIDLEKYKSEIDIFKTKEELNVSPNSIVISTVGRIAYQKNPVFLAEIFSEYVNINPNCELLWAGKGDMQEQVEDVFEKNNIQNKVHLLGARSDVPDILKCSDAFLLPSVFEGLGIVLVEAQATGLPCLASDTIPELANCGGVVSYSLNNTAKQWAEKLNDIINNKEKYNVDNKLLNEYSIEHMVSQMEEAFK